MTELYKFWEDALAGRKPPMHESDPRCGFYRMRSKNKNTGSVTWQPVAYFLEAGVIRCIVGDTVVSTERGQELWTFAGQYPVTEEAYRTVAENGGDWPDQDSIVAQQTAGIGDNSSAVEDIAVLSDQIKAAADGKSKYLKITNQQQSEQAQSLRSRLLELAGQATKAKKKKADPLYKDWKDVNAKWNPIIEEAEGAAAAIKAANDRYLTEQLNASKAAAAEAETSEMMEPETVPVVPTQVKGAYGRAASAKPEWVIKEIKDWDALYQHFKDKAAVKEALEKLAKAAVKTGEVPGVEREEVIRTK